MKWKPIETAPKSDAKACGNRLLLYIKGAGAAFGRCYDDGDGGVLPVPEGYCGEWIVTHWMPIPDPPESEVMG